MKMEYVNVNGYLIPKLENGPITDNTIGKYGMMRARYLDEHRPMERDQMLLDGTLAQHLTNIDCEAHRQVESLTKVLAAEAKINEEMKRCNPLEWAAAMQGLQAQAEEIVCAELIYAEENTNDFARSWATKRLLRLCCQSAKDRIFQYGRYAAVNRLHTEQG